MLVPLYAVYCHIAQQRMHRPMKSCHWPRGREHKFNGIKMGMQWIGMYCGTEGTAWNRFDTAYVIQMPLLSGVSTCLKCCARMQFFHLHQSSPFRSTYRNKSFHDEFLIDRAFLRCLRHISHANANWTRNAKQSHKLRCQCVHRLDSASAGE